VSAAQTAQQIGVEVATFLAAHHTMSLATVDTDGHAHAANLLYALDGLTLVWTSDPRSRHSMHIERDAIVAATVAPDFDDFRAIRGVQIHGHARRIVDPVELERARAALGARYSFLGQLAQGPVALLKAWRDAGFYCLLPARVTLIDNSRGFGHKTVLELAPDGGVCLSHAGPGL